MTAIDAENRFGQLIEAAQREPVTVTKQSRASVVVMSAKDYQRRKKRAWKNLIRTLEDTGAYAISQGLTQAQLDQLLADES